jgi:hypothetical protein
MTYIQLSKGDLEAKYRMAISRLQLATNELEYLEEGGYGRTLHFALAKLSEALYDVIANRDHDAEKYGFTPRDGIGPGDWKEKNQ